MGKSLAVFDYKGDFITENGALLHKPSLSYTTYGTINNDGSNIVWVCHALTADSDVFSWWTGLFGENDLFNPNDYFIICVNNPGSCYGSIGPLSTNPETGKIYGHSFPVLTVRDIAHLFGFLRIELNITKIKVLIGGSQGGQIAQELIVTSGFRVDNLILIATNAFHSAWGIAFNESQRLCIRLDPTWKTNDASAGIEGMKVARSLALLSYRNYSTYEAFQTDEDENSGIAKAVTYQRYQGEKLANRFNAYSYYTLSEIMDSHRLGKGRKSTESSLNEISAKTLIIGVSSDILFPASEQEFLNRNIKNSIYKSIDSVYGHDGFLIETTKLSTLIEAFLREVKKPFELEKSEK